MVVAVSCSAPLTPPLLLLPMAPPLGPPVFPLRKPHLPTSCVCVCARVHWAVGMWVCMCICVYMHACKRIQSHSQPTWRKTVLPGFHWPTVSPSRTKSQDQKGENLKCSGFARVNKVTSASLGYPLSDFNKNSTLMRLALEPSCAKRHFQAKMHVGKHDNAIFSSFLSLRAVPSEIY